jgi:hypothetical protein
MSGSLLSKKVGWATQPSERVLGVYVSALILAEFALLFIGPKIDEWRRHLIRCPD